AVAAIAAYGTIALWVNRLDADQPFTLRFAGREILAGLLGLDTKGSPHLTGDFGEWFPLSLLLLGLGATVWIVAGWRAPWRHRVRPGTPAHGHAHALGPAWGPATPPPPPPPPSHSS